MVTLKGITILVDIESCNYIFSSAQFLSKSTTVYPKKYAHGYCFAVLCCGYTLTDLPISIRITSLALWQSNDCPSASKATLMNMDKYFMWIHYERLHNHNKAKHNKTVCIFLGIYCLTVLLRIMSRKHTQWGLAFLKYLTLEMSACLMGIMRGKLTLICILDLWLMHLKWHTLWWDTLSSIRLLFMTLTCKFIVCLRQYITIEVIHL